MIDLKLDAKLRGFTAKMNDLRLSMDELMVEAQALSGFITDTYVENRSTETTGTHALDKEDERG